MPAYRLLPLMELREAQSEKCSTNQEVISSYNARDLLRLAAPHR
jgi:hypothetical protein